MAPNQKRSASAKSLSLKQLADHVGLAPATVSLILNGTASVGIAPATRDRVLEAARKLNYRPNFYARALRTGKTFTIGVLVPEVSEGYNVSVLSGIEEYLLKEGYFYFVASHHLQQKFVEDYVGVFQDRGVDGLIVACAPWNLSVPIPVVTISSQHEVRDATSIVLDHQHAVELALKHLLELGHSKIAYIRGTDAVPDASIRWNTIMAVSRELGLTINPKLVMQIEDTSPSGLHLGYAVTQRLLDSGEKFTALFAFNDVSAMGAIRAMNECCLRVPEDVSVVGFDDIASAAFQTRGLTTVRQPLREMGRLAAETLLQRISGKFNAENPAPEEIVVKPELIVRETTRALRASNRKAIAADNALKG